MIDLEFVERLIQALDASGLDSLELERGGTRIRLSRSPGTVHAPSGHRENPTVPQPAVGPGGSSPGGGAPSAAPAAPGVSVSEQVSQASQERLLEVTSPMVGTFYRAPAPDTPPYVQVGDNVRPGSVLCIIEAMKLMNELEAEMSGTVVKILVENAQPVEYGQVLFLIDPS